MSWPCKRVAGKECDCCGDCDLDMLGMDNSDDPKESPICEECGQPAESDGYYYSIEGTVLCAFCVDKLYRKDAV